MLGLLDEACKEAPLYVRTYGTCTLYCVYAYNLKGTYVRVIAPRVLQLVSTS